MTLTKFTREKIKELFKEFSIIASHPIRLLPNQDVMTWRATVGSEDRLKEWEQAGRPHEILVLVQHADIIGAVDVGYGGDFLYNGHKWEWSSKGVFQEEWCFMSDYYGYSGGGLFRRIK